VSVNNTFMTPYDVPQVSTSLFIDKCVVDYVAFLETYRIILATFLETYRIHFAAFLETYRLNLGAFLETYKLILSAFLETYRLILAAFLETYIGTVVCVGVVQQRSTWDVPHYPPGHQRLQPSSQTRPRPGRCL
jgi:hypothetical protein